MKSGTLFRILALIASVLFATEMTLTAPAHAAQIGVASVVRNDVNGNIGGRARVIQVGTSVFQNEVISTGPDSSAQLLFRDETSMTLGADSQLKLDRFVYDPRSKTGDIAVSVAKGAFRFVTGSADPRSYKIQTPVATMGIRGTILEGYMSPLTGMLTIVVVEGTVVVALGDGTSVTLNAGQYLTISSTGSVVAGPASWTGPTLDLDAGVRFAFDSQGNLLQQGGDPLPQWTDFNDALDSRDLDVTFPPGDGGTHGKITTRPPPVEEIYPEQFLKRAPQ